VSTFNQVTLLGRIGNDIELKQIGSSQVVNLRVATNKKYKDATGVMQEKTYWHNVSIWGKTAEIVNAYCVKGSLVLITGELQYKEYKKQGVDTLIAEIFASNVQIVSAPDNRAQTENKIEHRKETLKNYAPTGVDEKEPFPF
jgi:single-strand DNA-binding protein